MAMDGSAPKREVLFEGLSDKQILSLPKEEVDHLIARRTDSLSGWLSNPSRVFQSGL